MAKKQRLTIKEREMKLLEQIEKHKKTLIKLQEKRKFEIGGLACQHGLDILENNVLDEHFKKIAEILL